MKDSTLICYIMFRYVLLIVLRDSIVVQNYQRQQRRYKARCINIPLLFWYSLCLPISSKNIIGPLCANSTALLAAKNCFVYRLYEVLIRCLLVSNMLSISNSFLKLTKHHCSCSYTIFLRTLINVEDIPTNFDLFDTCR